MIQKILSIVAILMLIGWLAIVIFVMPKGGHDGELIIGILVLLDILVFLLGAILIVTAAKRRASFWIPIAVIAVPVMHLLGCATENPLDMVCFIFPIAVLPFVVVYKWKKIQQ